VFAASVGTPTRRPRTFEFGRQSLYQIDCLEYLASAQPHSLSAVVTDPPFGLIEYTPKEQAKLRARSGGVWRIPPSFDGAERSPLPRFTVLSTNDRNALLQFYQRWGVALFPILKPGAHLLIASNPLLSPLVAMALEGAGFERRGEIVRLVRTFRGGDRPKGAEKEFAMVSTMPRSCWEPWGLFRRPLETKTVAQNLRKWGTGALRRVSAESPFSDVIESGTTPDRERKLAPHPSVKPQAFLRRMVQAMLPTGEGRVFDPFAGSATTLAACEACGIEGIGTEIDEIYYRLASKAIPKLAAIKM
jgi:DNA modification methylase